MRLIASLPPALIAAPAWAHLGHLGEVAGHGHWIGLAAAAGAAVLAGWLAGKLGEKDGDAEEQEPGPDAATEAGT